MVRRWGVEMPLRELLSCPESDFWGVVMRAACFAVHRGCRTPVMKSRVRRRLAWIFAGIMAPTVVGSSNFDKGKDRVNLTHAGLKDLQESVTAYGAEYHHYPTAYPRPLVDTHPTTDRREESTGTLMASLLGYQVDTLNPRMIEFLEEPPGRGGSRLVEGRSMADCKVLDSWGHPYVILMDTNRDHKLDNPDAKNSSARIRQGAPATLDASVLVFSLGRDGIEGTHDDVVSWRDPDPVPSLGDQIWNLGRSIFAFAILALFLNAFVQLTLLILEYGRGGPLFPPAPKSPVDAKL